MAYLKNSSYLDALGPATVSLYTTVAIAPTTRDSPICFRVDDARRPRSCGLDISEIGME